MDVAGNQAGGYVQAYYLPIIGLTQILAIRMVGRRYGALETGSKETTGLLISIHEEKVNLNAYFHDGLTPIVFGFETRTRGKSITQLLENGQTWR